MKAHPVRAREGERSKGEAMITAELTEREAVFLTDLLENVSGLNTLDPESRSSVRELIQSIQDKIKLRGADENSIF